jgi:adenylate cyclase class IV
MIEVELKFEIPARARTLLQARLAALPSVRCLEYLSHVDRYYDTEHFECLQQEVFLRIRNNRRLEIKFHESADPAHTHCTERLFPLQAEPSFVLEMNALCARFLPQWREAETIEEAIRVNGLLEFAHLVTLRTRYACEDLILCLDDVEGLGDFFEIETACEEPTQVEHALARLHSFVCDLAFPSLQLVHTGYVELWLRCYHPHIYQGWTHRKTRRKKPVLNTTTPLSVARH